MTFGINYPWTVFDGKPIYGCDFGTNVWGSHAGVTAHPDDVRQDFAVMAASGIEVVRWFVFTDGRGGLRWDSRGNLAGLAEKFLDDMDCALEIARGAGVKLCPVLFDFSWMRRTQLSDSAGRPVFETQPDLLRTPEGVSRVLAGIVEPFLDRYGGHDAIHSFDVINEPDWVTEGLAFHRRHASQTAPFAIEQLRAFIRSVVDLIHDRSTIPATVGGALVRHASEWDREEYGLDFIQVHSYPDARRPERDESVIGRRADALGVSKPVLIGEFPANGDRQHPIDHHPPPFYLEDYLALAREGGYLGAWPWSFKGVDACGAVDLRAVRGAATGDIDV